MQSFVLFWLSLNESFIMVSCHLSVSTSLYSIFSTRFRFLSPLSAAPLVALTGFGLYEFGFPLVCDSFAMEKFISYTFLFTFLVFIIGFSQWCSLSGCVAYKMRGNWTAPAHLSSYLFTGNLLLKSSQCFTIICIFYCINGCVWHQLAYWYHLSRCFMQYIPHLMSGDRHIFDRFAVIFSVIIVWIYAHLLTVGGAYKNAPTKTQLSCRTDRAGIISAAPW